MVNKIFKSCVITRSGRWCGIKSKSYDTVEADTTSHASTQCRIVCRPSVYCTGIPAMLRRRHSINLVVK